MRYTAPSARMTRPRPTRAIAGTLTGDLVHTGRGDFVDAGQDGPPR